MANTLVPRNQSVLPIACLDAGLARAATRGRRGGRYCGAKSQALGHAAVHGALSEAPNPLPEVGQIRLSAAIYAVLQ